MQREPLRTWFARHISQRTPDLPQVRGRVQARQRWRIVTFWSKLAAFPLSLVGVIAGVGFFILSMIEMSFLLVGLSALVLGLSIAMFVWVYMWATAASE